MQRPMRASVRLAFWLARRIIRRLAPDKVYDPTNLAEAWALAALFGGAVGKDTVSRVWRKVIALG
jgi:hypothetical protein